MSALTTQGTAPLDSESAQEIDQLIVSKLTDARELLHTMRVREGWRALGHSSFRSYIDDLKTRTGHSESWLYRQAAVAQLESGAGLDIGTVPEAAAREIRRVLPIGDYTDESREAALLMAYNRDGDDISIATAHQAAAMVRLGSSSAAGIQVLRNRVAEGRLTEATALALSEHVVANSELSELAPHAGDPRLLDLLGRLKNDSPIAYAEIVEDIYSTGHLPLANGEMVSLGEATAQDVVNYLNKRNSLVSQEEAALMAHARNSVAKYAREVLPIYFLAERVIGWSHSEAKFWVATATLAGYSNPHDAAWLYLTDEDRDYILGLVNSGLGPRGIYEDNVQEDAGMIRDKYAEHLACASLHVFYNNFVGKV